MKAVRVPPSSPPRSHRFRSARPAPRGRPGEVEVAAVERDVEMLAHLRGAGRPLRLRVDARQVEPVRLRLEIYHPIGHARDHEHVRPP